MAGRSRFLIFPSLSSSDLPAQLIAIARAEYTCRRWEHYCTTGLQFNEKLKLLGKLKPVKPENCTEIVPLLVTGFASSMNEQKLFAVNSIVILVNYKKIIFHISCSMARLESKNTFKVEPDFGNNLEIFIKLKVNIEIIETCNLKQIT